jgi:hypothetical protein
MALGQFELERGTASFGASKAADIAYDGKRVLGQCHGHESEQSSSPEPQLMPRRYKGWTSWTIALRKRMYRDNCPETTLTVEEVAEGIGADPAAGIGSKRFWNVCRDRTGNFDTIAKQGLLVEFEPTPEGSVEKVTFRLNEKWMEHFQRVNKRREVSAATSL